MDYSQGPQAEPQGGGGVAGSVALGLFLGMVWEVMRIQGDLRLGFSPPVPEIIIGWVGFSGFVGFLLMVFALAGTALYSAGAQARNPSSWEARNKVFRAKQRAGGYILGSGGLAAFGGGVMWAASRLGPEFRDYAGFARFTVFAGVVAVLFSIWYLKRDTTTL